MGARGPRMVLTVRSTTEYTAQLDDDADGTFDITMSSARVGGVITRVETRDADFDGAPDTRITETPATWMREELTTPAAGGPRAWTVLAAYSLPHGDFATCAPFAPVPPPSPPSGAPAPTGLCNELTLCNLSCLYADRATLDAHSRHVSTSLRGLGDVAIVTSGVGACDPTQAGLIENAMSALDTDLDRVWRVNPMEHTMLMMAVADVHLVYTCALPSCAPAIAWTQGPRHSAWGTDATLAVTAITTLVQGRDGSPFLSNAAVARIATREIVDHELFHLVHSHERDAGGIEARDRIYSCSRVAVEWRAGFEYYLGDVDQATSARDGAVCASMYHKAQFGRGNTRLPIDDGFYERFPGDFYRPPTCSVDDQTKPTGSPTCGVESYFCYCDQTPIPAADRTVGSLHQFECGVTCPAELSYNAIPCAVGVRPAGQYDRVGSMGGLGAGCTPVAPATY